MESRGVQVQAASCCPRAMGTKEDAFVERNAVYV
jgi:hypothetical protein